MAKKKDDTKKDDPTLTERAARVRRVRESLGLSRADMKKKYGISIATLQGWEDPRWGNLTDKGAKRLVKAYKQESLHITVEWFMYGLGPDPLFPYIEEPAAIYHVKLSEQAIINQELRQFYQHNFNAIDMIIQDDAMQPYLAPGDHVAGKRFFEADLKLALGFPCIIQTQEGTLLVRKLEQGSTSDVYTLTGINPETSNEQDVKVFSAAPIIWIRKPSVGPKK